MNLFNPKLCSLDIILFGSANKTKCIPSLKEIVTIIITGKMKSKFAQ